MLSNFPFFSPDFSWVSPTPSLPQPHLYARPINSKPSTWWALHRAGIQSRSISPGIYTTHYCRNNHHNHLNPYIRVYFAKCPSKNISYHQLPKIRETNLNLQDQYYVTILKPGWRLKAGGAGDNPGRWVSLVDTYQSIPYTLCFRLPMFNDDCHMATGGRRILFCKSFGMLQSDSCDWKRCHAADGSNAGPLLYETLEIMETITCPIRCWI